MAGAPDEASDTASARPSEAGDRSQTMAELRAALERERQTAAEGQPIPALPETAQPGPRDDELLDELPPTDHHLGGFAGWRATSKLRWIVGGVLGAVVVLGVVIVVRDQLELRHRRLHPLPELEATVRPGTPREATYTDGKFRIGLAREQPYINLVHLPDRDITLAPGAEKAQFKVEIREGRTVALEVLTGEIVETLTREDAEPLVEAP